MDSCARRLSPRIAPVRGPAAWAFKTAAITRRGLPWRSTLLGRTLFATSASNSVLVSACRSRLGLVPRCPCPLEWKRRLPGSDDGCIPLRSSQGVPVPRSASMGHQGIRLIQGLFNCLHRVDPVVGRTRGDANRRGRNHGSERVVPGRYSACRFGDERA